MTNPFDEVDNILTAYNSPGGLGGITSVNGDNCGDALAKYLNETKGYNLPRGGIGPGEVRELGQSNGAPIYGKGNISLDALTPGTIIHMTRQPGDKNYEYGNTHIGIVDQDNSGNSIFRSYTAGKGWREQKIDQNFINNLPSQIVATNPINPNTRNVSQKEQDIFASLKQPVRQGQRAFEPYQIAAAGSNIPGPPSNPFAEVDKMIGGRQLSEVDALIEGKGATPQSPPNFLAPKQPAQQPAPEEPTMIPDTLGQFGGLGETAGLENKGPEYIGKALNLPFKYTSEPLVHWAAQKGLRPALEAFNTRFGKATPEEINMVVNGLEGVGNIAAAPGVLKLFGMGGNLLKSGIGAIGRPVLGSLSGRGGGSVDEALKAGEAFKSGMRGETTAEDIVPAVQGAYNRLKKEISSTYKDKLQQIEGMRNPDGTQIQLDLAPVQSKLRDLMKDFKVKVDPEGNLDFSGSAIDEAAQSRIKKMIELVWTWEDKSPGGIDALKRRIGDFYSESSNARAFSAGLKNEVRDLLNNSISQYADMTGTYAKDINLSKDLGSNLMLRKEGISGRITPDQTYRRLLSTTHDKFVNRKNLLQTLGDRTGEDLTGMVAGHAMNQILPAGLMGKLTAAEIPLAMMHLINPGYLASVGLSSPRLQGEMLRLMGKIGPYMGQVPMPSASMAAAPYQAKQLYDSFLSGER
jgi:hypothetical protein